MPNTTSTHAEFREDFYLKLVKNIVCKIGKYIIFIYHKYINIKYIKIIYKYTTFQVFYILFMIFIYYFIYYINLLHINISINKY